LEKKKICQRKKEYRGFQVAKIYVRFVEKSQRREISRKFERSHVKKDMTKKKTGKGGAVSTRLYYHDRGELKVKRTCLAFV